MLCLFCSSLWAGSCPTGVYKNHKTDSCSYSTESGDSLCYVFRQHPDFWEDQDRLPSKGKESNDTVTRVRFHNKYEEFNLRAHSADRVSGPNSGLNPDESVSKVLDLIESCQAILSMTSLTARSLASLPGKMSSCLQEVLPAPTFYRAIHADIHQAKAKPTISAKKLILSSEAKSEIQWWIVNVHQWNGRPVHLPPPSLIITTDAAKTRGMGGIMQQIQNSGQVDLRGGFSPHKHFRTKGSPFAMKSFAKVYQMTNAHVGLKIDNTSAQAYISHQGGTKSVCLCNQAQEVWKWCLLHQTIVSAEHLPGIHNWDAD